MKLRDALKLYNEDEVEIKATNEIRTVVETERGKFWDGSGKEHQFVNVLLDDGEWYKHTDIA
jgi:hypothetical protein